VTSVTQPLTCDDASEFFTIGRMSGVYLILWTGQNGHIWTQERGHTLTSAALPGTAVAPLDGDEQTLRRFNHVLQMPPFSWRRLLTALSVRPRVSAISRGVPSRITSASSHAAHGKPLLTARSAENDCLA
jgi:hypothetical protein